MQLVLFLVTVATAAALQSHFNSSENISYGGHFEKAESESKCRSNFVYYEGWCVHLTRNNEYTYQEAVDECARVGAFAPSIHSDEDLKFWSDASSAWRLWDLWLDGYCPRDGMLYAWRDGTPTDYVDPNHVLRNCDMRFGICLAAHELEVSILYANMTALCAYNFDATTPRTTTTSSTTKLVTSTTKTTTQQPIIDDTPSYCSCNPNTIYLDIVFVVDTSDDMTRNLVGDATAAIQSTLFGLTFGTGKYQSNVAVIAYAETVQTVVNFGDFKSTKDISHFALPYLGGNPSKMAEAIKQASSMIYSNGRDFTRGVIVLITNSFDQRHASNIDEAAKAFKDDDGIIITIDYSSGLGIQGLEDITSPGFYINDTSMNPDLDADVLYALCDANCFCKDGLTSYDVPNERGRTLPKGCYHVSGFSAVYDAAVDNCQNMDGFVATIHDDDKNFFMISLFPLKSRYWIGLRKNGSMYEWADDYNGGTTYWAPGNPISGQDCVYGQQQTGFNSPWFSAPCTDPLKYSMPYACQLRPCGSDYDCWA